MDPCIGDGVLLWHKAHQHLRGDDRGVAESPLWKRRQVAEEMVHGGVKLSVQTNQGYHAQSSLQWWPSRSQGKRKKRGSWSSGRFVKPPRMNSVTIEWFSAAILIWLGSVGTRNCTKGCILHCLVKLVWLCEASWMILGSFLMNDSSSCCLFWEEYQTLCILRIMEMWGKGRPKI